MKLRAAHLVFGVAVLTVLFAIFTGWLRKDRALPAAKPALEGQAFAAELPRVAPTAFVQWNDPGAQSAGREWIFEVFTPPIIYFDPENSRFTVRPPLEPEAAPVFGLTVTAIERVPYRLQYAGHHGEAGRYFVEIRDLSEDAYYRGRVGEYFEDGAFTLRRFVADVRRVQPPDRPWATPYLETFIEVEVMDAILGETVRFGREPLFLPDPVAVLVPDATREPRKLGVGESLESPDGRYTVESIDEARGEVVVAKYDFSGAFEERQSFSLETTPEAPPR